MVAKVLSGMVTGIEGRLITIQADISEGLPVFHMVGYLSSEVKEAKERVRTSFKNIGCPLPPKRISVNLAPADFRKKGVQFDLGIAVALLIATGRLSQSNTDAFIILGELSLDGRIKAAQGILPIICEAFRQGIKKCIIPRDNQKEASLIKDMEIYAFDYLKDVYEFLNGNLIYQEIELPSAEVDKVSSYDVSIPDFSEIKGQKLAKRALEIAVAGAHNVFLGGPPGSGKSMLSSAAAGIIPPMNYQEQIESMRIYSVKGLLHNEQQISFSRPFRSPGQSVTASSMFGGGVDPRPGEISLAHHGILFLDEFVEYKRDILEMLRIPLEEHEIKIVRNERTITFPADFILIAAANKPTLFMIQRASI